MIRFAFGKIIIRSFLIIFTLLGYGLPLLSFAQESEVEEQDFLSEGERMKRVSVALGYEAGRRAKQKQMRKKDVIDAEFEKGFQLALEGQELPYSPDQLQEAFLVF